MSGEVAVLHPPAPPAPRSVVIDPIPVLDTARFEQMQRIARIMATTSMCPEALCGKRDGDRVEWFPPDVVVANCFMVTNQAVRWGMDPFAVAQSVSIVRGKLCYEGKLVSAVLDAKLGVNLLYDWDDKTGDAAGIIVSGTLPGEPQARTISGTVGDWKTTGANSPWRTPQSCRRQLAYRGAREWARIHKPALMLGVYTEDEMEALVSEARASHSRGEALPPVDVTSRSGSRLPPPPPKGAGAKPPADAPPASEPGSAATAEAPAAAGQATPEQQAPSGSDAVESSASAAKTPPAPPKPPIITSGKAPPAPPKAASAPPPAAEFSFDAFRDAVNAAETRDQANDVYDRMVTGFQPPLSDDDLTECDRILNEACERFWRPED